MTIRAGELSNRVGIERPAPEQDEYGQQVHPDRWPEVARVWAKVEPVGSRDFAFARSFAATVSHKVTIRYRDDVLPNYRIRYRGERLLKINGIINVGEEFVALELYCTEQVNGGA